MLAIDTNVLVRLIERDHPLQSKAAAKLLAEAEQSGGIYVSDVVLAEVAWVLKSSYRRSRSEVSSVVRHLLETSGVTFRSLPAVARALDHFLDGNADLSDYLIAEEAAEAGCSALATFDKALRASHPLAFAPEDVVLPPEVLPPEGSERKG